MKGIIYVGGLYGAGKTTMISAALKGIDSLQGIPTHTTRPARSGENDGKKFNYIFVTQEEYDERRRESLCWDHTEIADYSYGTDANLINDRIARGEAFIVSAPNDVIKIEQMKQYYIGNSYFIWIDTPLEICNQRLLERGDNSTNSRLIDATQTSKGAAEMRARADIIFSPTNNLEQDKRDFVTLIKNFLNT